MVLVTVGCETPRHLGDVNGAGFSVGGDELGDELDVVFRDLGLPGLAGADVAIRRGGCLLRGLFAGRCHRCRADNQTTPERCKHVRCRRRRSRSRQGRSGADWRGKASGTPAHRHGLAKL